MNSIFVAVLVLFLRVSSQTIVTVVDSMVNETVVIPCLAIQHSITDSPVLLLFYRDDSSIPFFSYDARSGEFWRQGSPKTREPRYEGRISLDFTKAREVSLVLQKVSLKDEGIFTCRVDFQGSPSLTSKVQLKVYANPELGPTVAVANTDSKVISNTHATRGRIGPFFKGETLNLTCTVVGGHPLPNVVWWQDTKLLDNSSKVIRGQPNKVINDVIVGPLTKELVALPYTCRAKNNPLSPPMDNTVFIKIHVAPERVRLPSTPIVQAGIQQELKCVAEEAYPEANISWHLNGKPLNFTNKETRLVNGSTVSWVRFVPRAEHNGAIINCTAVSLYLPDAPISNNTQLNVTHLPVVELRMGQNLNPDSIRQGEDVYFDCIGYSNPPIQRISWFKELEEVSQNVTEGILLQGTNLVLQAVQRKDAGNYECRATNSIGTTTSNSVPLSVQYAPSCAQQRRTVTALEGEIVILECQVDAYPPNVTFQWLFNNTVDSTRFGRAEFSVEGSSSQLRYVAYSARDYGTVFCWAENMVGRQDEPCVFILQPAGAPDSVRDCVLTNQSAGSLHITCHPGADGGLQQSYRVEVFAGGSSTPVRVLEGNTPIFSVEGLSPGGDYVVTVTAFNRKGFSPPISLQAYTLKVAENRMISGMPSSVNPETSEPEPEQVELSPLVGALVGVVVAVVLMAGTVVFLARRQCVRRRQPDLVGDQEMNRHSDSAPSKDTVETRSGDTPTERTGGHIPNGIEDELFLGTSDTTSLATPRSTSSLGDPAGGVFTIPSHIPPPPQYCTGQCTDLSPTQHALEHVAGSISQGHPETTFPTQGSISGILEGSLDLSRRIKGPQQTYLSCSHNAGGRPASLQYVKAPSGRSSGYANPVDSACHFPPRQSGGDTMSRYSVSNMQIRWNSSPSREGDSAV